MSDAVGSGDSREEGRAETSEQKKLVYIEQIRIIYSQIPTALVGGAVVSASFLWIQESAKRTGDLAARYGGEELALILPDTEADDAYRITESIREGVCSLGLRHEASRVEGCDVVTISAGIARMIPGMDSVPSDVVKTADEALYEAKRNGRNQTVRERGTNSLRRARKSRSGDS